MGSGPGGVANLAVACSRLGLKTSLAAAFGEDLYGDYCRQTLSIQEGVDLTYSRYVTGWHSPVTVSVVYERERTMVTHGHIPEVEDQLVRQPPRARVSFIDLGHKRQPWVDTFADDGGLVFADLGWDQEDRWDIGRLRESLQGCYSFSPNSMEAMSYTRTDSPEAALDGACRSSFRWPSSRAVPTGRSPTTRPLARTCRLPRCRWRRSTPPAPATSSWPG